VFRLALIGSGGHWQEYPRVLQDIEGARVVAVAPGEPGEALARFDGAPGVSAQTARHQDYRALIEAAAAGGMDAIQVCVKPYRTAAVVAECLRAGVPVMADKPLAMDEAQLGELWRVHRETGTFLAPMHMYRRMSGFALARDLVRAGAVGDVMAGHCQISFRWGAARPDWFKTRETYPGTFAFIGVHAVDTLYWVAGDCFGSVRGHQSTAPHPDYPACASLAYATVELLDGGAFVLSADFLRPMGASSHADVRLRVAGTSATLDCTERDDGCVAVVDATQDRTLPAPEIPYWYTTFARHVLGEDEPFIRPLETFRVTELTLRIQAALDSQQCVDLRPTSIAL